MNTDEIKILTERLIPVPKKIKFKDGSVYQLRKGCSVSLYGPAAIRKTESEKLKRDYGKRLKKLQAWLLYSEG